MRVDKEQHFRDIQDAQNALRINKQMTLTEIRDIFQSFNQITCEDFVPKKNSIYYCMIFSNVC